MHPTFSSFNFHLQKFKLALFSQFFSETQSWFEWSDVDFVQAFLCFALGFFRSNLKSILHSKTCWFCLHSLIAVLQLWLFFAATHMKKVKAVKLHQSQKTGNFLHQWVVRFQMSFTSQNSHSVKSFCKLHKIFVLCLDGANVLTDGVPQADLILLVKALKVCVKSWFSECAYGIHVFLNFVFCCVFLLCFLGRHELSLKLMFFW